MSARILLLVACACLSCGPAADRKQTISVSILPQRYFVERVAGDLVKVNVMIPPGANPATCDMTPGQMKELERSSIYFAVGYLPFEETHLYPLLEKRKDILLVSHSEGEQLLEGTEGTAGTTDGHHHLIDPHIWMSPARAKRMAVTIARVLGEQFGDQRERFEKNLRQLTAEIDSIDNEARRLLAKKQNKVFLVYHPALTYFADDYGMEQLVIEHEGKEPSPLHLKRVIDACRERSVKTVFIQGQFDKQNAIAVAREINGQVIAIDPLNPDWKAEMLSLLSIIDAHVE
ncbi:MAG: zinc ABC transporter substrate-binding protein [Odoribacteraceae bacterium]|jgi:zinc transport system substrate-binding protein|nr:zinc ABC transporter substrate-binding protein [Odoribacteraceae bacterium]